MTITHVMTQRPSHVDTDINTPVQIERIRCAVLALEHEALAAFWSGDGHTTDEITLSIGQCAGHLHQIGVDRHVPACCMPGQVEVNGVCVWPPDDRPFVPEAAADGSTAASGSTASSGSSKVSGEPR